MFSSKMQKTRLGLVLLVFLLFIFPTESPAQVLINEICPSNVSVNTNFDGEYDDWIELYNAGASPVNLSGYGLSDDGNDKYKFVFPYYTLNAGERLLVFAADQNVNSIVDHWETAVSASTTWKYFAANNTAPDTNWRNISFNDGSWNSGSGGIGYGDNDDATQISTSYNSVMMRKTFFVSDTSEILKAIVNMDYDDGFVAYLNGTEIARANMGPPGARPLFNDLAPQSHEALMYQGMDPDSFFVDINLLKAALVQGMNVFAVEVHNTTTNSNDLSSIPFLSFGMKSPGMTYSATPSWFHAPPVEYFNADFKLSRSGESVYLTDNVGTIIDSYSYVDIDIDNSIGRSSDGAGTWCLFGTPTPGTSNSSSTCYNGYASSPMFSVAAGYYQNTQWLTLSTTAPGGVIRYTTNGDDPTSSSSSYSSPILLNSTKVIRAKVFASGYLPSPIITNSYFVNEDDHLPVFSISTDSDNLWDWNTGIYVMGPNAQSTSPYKGANFWQDWRKPACIEYYDKDKNRLLRFDAEIRIYGNYSRAKPQKSLEIMLSDRFGTGEINLPFWPEKPFINDFDNFILRNSGTDWNIVHYRDAFMERLLRTTHAGYLAAEPAVMYLNGEYWGVFTIHENHDHHWMEYNYGLKEDQIDYLKEDGSTISVKNGSDASFWDMYNYATTADPLSAGYYNYLKDFLDFDNYADYFIAETYYNNGDWIGDWTNNIKMWRPSEPGGKWRYLTYDLDFGCGYAGSVNDDRIAIARNPVAFSHSSEMFDAILNNPTFRTYFINRYADLINTIFKSSYAKSISDSYEDSMQYDMPNHFAKWGSNTSTWHSNINSMRSFLTSRPQKVRDQIQADFGLTNQVELEFETSPAGSGRILVNTIIPDSYSWEGTYFDGNPVTIRAIPNPGYTFNHWRSDHIINSNDHNITTTYNFNVDDEITAYFTGSPESPKITISEFNYHSDSSADAGDWIELHNYGTVDLDISNWKVRDENDYNQFELPVGTEIPAGGYLVLAEDLGKFSSRYPSVNNVIGPLGFSLNNGGESIRLFDYSENLLITINYQDISPWPVQADGGGYTCELLDPLGDLNDGNNWFAGCMGGSPGTGYTNILGTPVSVSGSTTFCTGGSLTLDATYVPGYTYQWLESGTNIPGETNSSITITNGGAYSVRVDYAGCSAISDTVNVTVVNQGPDPVVQDTFRCGPGTVTLFAQSTDSVYWFDAPGGNIVGTGNTYVTPSLSTTTTYYAQTSLSCPSNAIPAVATIDDIAAIPVSSDVTRCGPGGVTLVATDTSDTRWYNAPSGGALLYTGDVLSIPYIANDSVFYVESGTTCPSPRLEINVVVNAAPAPVGIDGDRCGNGSVTISATSALPIAWYTALTGGSPLSNNATFTTPVLTATTTFYAEAVGVCPSVRVPVLAMVNPIPSVPIVSDVSRCDSGSVTINATSPEQIYWYDAPVGGNLLQTGTIFTSPSLTTTTVYFLEAGYLCRSPRVSVQAIINATPEDPVAVDGYTCGPGIVTLSATSSAQIYWYDAPVSGNLMGTGSTYITPVLTSGITYYVQAGDDCPSNRVPVLANVFSQPTVFLGNDTSFQSGSSLTLDAGGGFSSYQWSTGETTQSIAVNSTATYSVTVTDPNGCTASDDIVVTVFNGTGNGVFNTVLSVYPNPASEFVRILIPAAKAGRGILELTDESGRLLYSKIIYLNPGSNAEKINLRDYSSGIYTLRVRSDDSTITTRLTVE